MPDQNLMLLDGNSLINRAYFGLLGRNNLTAPDGTPTGALFAFVNMYLRYLEEIKPTHVAAAFDRKEPTFRHKIYDGYKATRKPMPDDLAVQLPILKELLQAMGVKCLETAGYEADDLLGTLAAAGKKNKMPVMIVTGDKDSFQLIDDGIAVLQPITRGGKSETDRYDAAAVLAKFQVTPAQFIDLKAIMGDPSDNIPGIKGIGEKGAAELIARFGSLDGVYAALDQIRPAMAEKLRGSKEMAYLSQHLATICQTVPLPVAIDDLKLQPMRPEVLVPMLNGLGFKNILARLNLQNQTAGQQPAAKTACQEGDLRGWQDLLAADPDLPAVWLDDRQEIYWTADSENIRHLPAAELPAFWSALQASRCRPAVFDYKQLLKRTGLTDLTAGVHDVMIMAYLLNQAEGRPDLARLYQRVTGELLPDPNQPLPEAKEAPRQQTDLFAALGESAPGQPKKNDGPNIEQEILAGAVQAVARQQKTLVAERGIDFLAYEVEMPLAGILAAMELRGFALDTGALDELSADMAGRLENLQQKIYELSGRSFNLNSPRQLSEVLYQDLGLATGKKRTGGAFSTDSDELERLADEHPAIPLIIEHRQIAKLRSTFVEGLKKAIDPADGRVHTTFSQAQTATGRLSSSEPNLQNIPIRMEAGQLIRRAFVAAPGTILLDADYSQIELRLLAHLADDQAMIDAFVRSEDIHVNTASKIFNCPPQQVTPEMRSIAKTMNFSIVYGISDFGLARDLGIPVRQAHRYIAEYEAQYPQVRKYLDQLIEAAYRDGYVETMLGRRRYMTELKSANRSLRQFGERAAMNTPVQGTAADLIKLAMVRAAGKFRQSGLQAGLILQVHDELIVEAPLPEAAAAAAILKEAMENVVSLKVPLIAEVRQGRSWADCK